MPAAQGNKDQSFLTAKEKWLIGIFIATGVTAILTFVVTLVLIIQLKESANLTHEGNAQGSSTPASTSNECRKQLEELKNLTLQNQKETENLRLKFRTRTAKLENKMDDVVVKTNILLYLEKLEKEGWKKLSNGLRYKRFFNKFTTYEDASDKCKKQRARLASTGIRSATIRSEISNKISGEWNWIGLNQPYDNTTWVWSDGELYENADMPWDSACMTETGQHVRISFQRIPVYMNCYGSTASRDGYICEI